MNDKDKKNVEEVDLLNCKIGMNGSGKSFYKKLQSIKNTRDHNANLDQHEITAACYVDEVEPPNAPGKPFRQRDHYTHIILDIYAVHHNPCDSSDKAVLNEKLHSNQLQIVSEIDSGKYWGYTHLIHDEEDFYIVTLSNTNVL